MAGQRNAGHRAEHAARLAAATGDMERLALAGAWFRSSLALLARRRPPRGFPQQTHEVIASRLARDAITYLTRMADAIDRGEYDAK